MNNINNIIDINNIYINNNNNNNKNNKNHNMTKELVWCSGSNFFATYHHGSLQNCSRTNPKSPLAF